MTENQLARIKILNIYHTSTNGFTEDHIKELEEILRMLKGD